MGFSIYSPVHLRPSGSSRLSSRPLPNHSFPGNTYIFLFFYTFLLIIACAHIFIIDTLMVHCRPCLVCVAQPPSLHSTHRYQSNHLPRRSLPFSVAPDYYDFHFPLFFSIIYFFNNYSSSSSFLFLFSILTLQISIIRQIRDAQRWRRPFRET